MAAHFLQERPATWAHWHSTNTAHVCFFSTRLALVAQDDPAQGGLGRDCDFLLGLGNVVTLQWLLRRSDNIAATLNLAGKMRMLGQRAALETLAARQDPSGDWLRGYDSQVQTFERAYQTLAQGGSAAGHAPLPLNCARN